MYIYIWDETVASRGADEIAPIFKHTLPTNIQQLTCYSDSCFGQKFSDYLFLEPSSRKTFQTNRP